MATYKEILGKKGKKIQVTIRKKGYQTLYKTFSKKSEAKDWALEVEAQMKNGTWSRTQKRINSPIQTVNDLIDYFEKNVAPQRYSKFEQYKVMYNWWRDKIGQLPLSELDSSILEKCKNILMSEAPNKPYKEHSSKSISTVRKYIFALSAILRYGSRSLKVLDRNPMSDVDKPKKRKKDPRFLSDDERDRLFKKCKEHSDMLYVFVLIAVFAGGRYSEILKLEVKNIDTENNMLLFTETKNGESRGVPIYDRVMQHIVEYLQKHDITSGYIFYNKNKNKPYYIKGALEKIIKDANIENFRIHDLRHTYASYLAQNGATLLEIADLMGHKNLNQVQIYAHLTKKTTAKIVRKMTANMWDFE